MTEQKKSKRQTPEQKLLGAVWAMVERHRGGTMKMSREFIESNPDVVEYVKEKYDVTMVAEEE